MNDKKLAKLNTLLALLKEDTISPKDIETFLLLVLDVIKKTKTEFDTVSKDTLTQVANALEFIRKEHANTVSGIGQRNRDLMDDCDEKVSEMKQLFDKTEKIANNISKEINKAKEYFSTESKNRKEDIINETLGRIVFPTQVLDGPGELVLKLQSLDGSDRLHYTAIDGLEEFIDERIKIAIPEQSHFYRNTIGGGVTQIKAGTGISITSTGSNGRGVVTITATGGGGGTPGGANTQVQFNDSGSFGGDNYFTWDKTGNILGLGIEAGVGKLYGVTATSANTTGGSLSLVTGNGLGSGDGGLFEIIGGNGGATGNGAEVRLIGGTGGATLGNGGGIKISGVSAQTGTGGDGGRILFEIGAADGGGTNGYYGFTNLGGIIQTLDFDSVINPNTYTFPDKNGTVALLNSSTLGTFTVDNLVLATNTVTGTLGLNFINNANDSYRFRSFTNTGIDAILDTSLVATSDKTYTLQNASGTLAFLSDIVSPTLTNTYIGVGNGSNLLSGSSAFTYASGRITNTATTTQQRLAYNASTDFVDTTVSSNGSTAFAITSSSGTPTFNFNKEMIVDLGTIPYVGQYAHHIKATDVLFGGTYEIITNFGYNYTTQYWSAQSRNPGIIEFDGGTQSFSFRSGNGGYTDIFGYNKLDLRTLSGQNVRIMNGSTVNIQVTTGGNIELQDSVKLLTYGSGTHSGTTAYYLSVTSSGDIIEVTAPGTATPRAETPSGLVNSSNVTYTLANTPIANLSVIVTLDGLVQRNGAGLDYTVSGTTITFATAPVTGTEIFAYYSS